jgi:hypothetical protein
MSLYKFFDWIDVNRINWISLSENKNPYAINILEKNIDKIDWWNLSRNKNAICILEKNIDKIDWWNFSRNKKMLFIY